MHLGLKQRRRSCEGHIDPVARRISARLRRGTTSKISQKDRRVNKAAWRGARDMEVDAGATAWPSGRKPGVWASESECVVVSSLESCG